MQAWPLQLVLGAEAGAVSVYLLLGDALAQSSSLLPLLLAEALVTFM